MTDNTANDLLDMTLDDLEDMPEFLVLPAGVLRVNLSIAAKTVNAKKSVEVTSKVLEVVELSDPTEASPAVGSEASVLYQMDNELGQGALKNLLKPVLTYLALPPETKLGAIAEHIKGMEFYIVSKPRWNKDKTQQYNGIASLTVV